MSKDLIAVVNATQKFSHYTNSGAIFTIDCEYGKTSGKTPSHKLCRLLVEKGIDGELAVFNENGELLYTIASIWLHSTLQTYEGDKSGFVNSLYVPFTKGDAK